MNDEFVDILDEFGNPTGEIKLKSEAHAKGLFHPTVHIWFYTHNGYLLFQQRAFIKETYPGLWDVSVAGHISAGEKPLTSAIREVKEEIGLDIIETDLKKIGVHKYIRKHSENLIDCEFHHTFISELKTPIENLVLQKSELNDVKLILLDDFEKALLDKNLLEYYVVLDTKYYDMVIKAIKKELD